MELHQDDVHVAGPPKELEKFSKDLGKNVKMKWSPVLLPGMRYSHLKNFRVIYPDGRFIYPNPKYAKDIIASLGMQDAKPAPTPIACTRLVTDAEFPCSNSEATLYRHCVSVARFLRNYLPASNFCCEGVEPWAFEAQ